MEPDIQKKFDEQNERLNAIYQSVEKTRKYFLWLVIIAVAGFVVPLVGLAVVIPRFIDVYTSGFGL